MKKYLGSNAKSIAKVVGAAAALTTVVSAAEAANIGVLHATPNAHYLSVQWNASDKQLVTLENKNTGEVIRLEGSGEGVMALDRIPINIGEWVVKSYSWNGGRLIESDVKQISSLEIGYDDSYGDGDFQDTKVWLS
ncbi:MAG: hypothetical protein ACU0AU_13755 [Cognatishimia activa]